MIRKPVAKCEVAVSGSSIEARIASGVTLPTVVEVVSVSQSTIVEAESIPSNRLELPVLLLDSVRDFIMMFDRRNLALVSTFLQALPGEIRSGVGVRSRLRDMTVSADDGGLYLVQCSPFWAVVSRDFQAIFVYQLGVGLPPDFGDDFPTPDEGNFYAAESIWPL